MKFSYIVYNRKRYAPNPDGFMLLAEAVIDRAKRESKIGFATFVKWNGSRKPHSVARLLS